MTTTGKPASPKTPPQDERAELSEHVDKWSTFVLSNILWAIVSIPLITLPAATAGLFAFHSARARGVPVDLFSAFFGGMRRHWRKATVLALIDVAIGGLIVVNASIFPRMDMTADPFAFMARSITLFAGLALLLINLYAWSLMVLLEDQTFQELLEAAVKLVFAHPLYSLGILIVAALPVIISLILPQGFYVLATVSLVALLVNMGTWRVIRQHLPPDLLERLAKPS